MLRFRGSGVLLDYDWVEKTSRQKRPPFHDTQIIVAGTGAIHFQRSVPLSRSHTLLIVVSVVSGTCNRSFWKLAATGQKSP